MFCRTKPGSDEFVDTQLFRRKYENCHLNKINQELKEKYSRQKTAPFSIKLINLDLFVPPTYSGNLSQFMLRDCSNPPESILLEPADQKSMLDWRGRPILNRMNHSYCSSPPMQR